jgi:hypothetical protein
MAVQAAPSPPPGGDPTPTPVVAAPSGVDRLKVIGGLLAVCAGLFALIVVVVVALIIKPDSTGASVATSAVGVIGSIVGAYLGVKIGSDGTQKAVDAAQQESTKAQVFALHADPADAERAIEHAKTLIESQIRSIR